MAFQGNRTGAAKAWFCLNPDEAVESMSAQNKGPRSLEIVLHTSGTEAPTSRAGSLTYLPGEALGADEALADRFPGGAVPGYVWGISSEPVTVSVGY